MRGASALARVSNDNCKTRQEEEGKKEGKKKDKNGSPPHPRPKRPRGGRREYSPTLSIAHFIILKKLDTI